MRRVQDLFREILTEEYAAAHKLFEDYSPVAGLPDREADWLGYPVKSYPLPGHLSEHSNTRFGFRETREIVTSLENPWYAEDTSFEHRGRRTMYAPESIVEEENFGGQEEPNKEVE